MPRTTVKSNSSAQPGFALKLAFREYLFELSANGTIVALAALGLLSLGGFLVWQHFEPTQLNPSAVEKPIGTNPPR